MSLSNVAQHILRVAQAIADGRIEAREVANMTEDQVTAYSDRLIAELDAGIASDEEALAEAEEQGETPEDAK